MFVRLKSVVDNLLNARRAAPAPAAPAPPAPAPAQPASIADGILSMIPDYSQASYVGGGGAEVFMAVGQEMVVRFRDYCDLKPDERVLEVGCGIGRIAIPLTQYLTAGSYEGFDIVPHGIEWCRQRVTPRYPRFHFFLADIRNDFYHPEGRQRASEYRFPFDDGTFDFVFLTSVFTHMRPRDVAHYIGEIGRVLRPGGRCFCTAYLVSEEAERHLAAGTSARKFRRFEDYWTELESSPESSLAHSEPYIRDLFEHSRLEITRTVVGRWWENVMAQDILIARRT